MRDKYLTRHTVNKKEGFSSFSSKSLQLVFQNKRKYLTFHTVNNGERNQGFNMIFFVKVFAISVSK